MNRYRLADSGWLEKAPLIVLAGAVMTLCAAEVSKVPSNGCSIEEGSMRVSSVWLTVVLGLIVALSAAVFSAPIPALADAPPGTVLASVGGGEVSF